MPVRRQQKYQTSGADKKREHHVEQRRPAQGHTPIFLFFSFPRAELGLVLLAMMVADFFRIPEVGLEPTISSLGGKRLIH